MKRSATLLLILVAIGCSKKNSDSGFAPMAGAGPVLPVAVAGEDQKVVVGDTVTLKGDKSYDPASVTPLTYSWSPAGPLSNAAIANPTFTAGAPGTYTFTLTVTGANGTDTDTVDVVVKTMKVTAPDTWWIGYGNSASITATVVGGTPPYTYEWTGTQPWVSVTTPTTTTTASLTNSLGLTAPTFPDFQNFPDVAGVAVIERTTQGRLQLKVRVTDSAGTPVSDEDYVNFSAGPFSDPVANENVALGEPVFLNGGIPAGASPSWTWTGTRPDGNPLTSTTLVTSDFKKPDKTGLNAVIDQRFVYFVPGLVGSYQIILTQNTVPSNPIVKVIDITCGKYVGVGSLTGKVPDPFKGECAACHAGQLGFLADFANPWKQTGHAHMFERILDPANPYYTASQAKGSWLDAFEFGSDFSIDSRAVGWSRPGPNPHAGWAEQASTEGFVFKGASWSELVRKFPKTAGLSNVQCESCHGPGSEHAGDTTGIRKSFDASVCGRCHADKFDRWETSGHGDRASAAFTSASGSASCNGCHTAQGFVVEMRAQEGADPHPVLFAVSNLNRPVIAAEDRQPQTCQACHEPHKRTVGMNNPTGPDPQLRSFGNVQFRNGAVWDAGRAADCAMCHQSRTDTRLNSPDMNVRRAPHDSTSAEMLAATNGQEFPGWTYLVSPHAIPSRFIVLGKTENRQCLTCHVDVQPAKGEDGYGAIGGHTFAMSQGDDSLVADSAVVGNPYEYPSKSQPSTIAGGLFRTDKGPSFLRKIFTGDELVITGGADIGTYRVGGVDGARQLTLTTPGGLPVTLTGGSVTAWTLKSKAKFNTAACSQCHTGAAGFLDLARADYDGSGGLPGPIQTELAGLQAKLLIAINAKLAVLTSSGANTLLVESGRIKYTDGGSPAVKRTFPGPGVPASEQPITWASVVLAGKDAEWLALYRAAYNYTFVKNDLSGGLHNTGYAVNLLQSSYNAVTGATVGSPFVPFP
jgi:PKD repeat protein